MSRRARAVLLALGAVTMFGSCVPREEQSAPIAPETPDPEFRVGLFVNVAKVTLGGGDMLRIEDPAAADIGVIPAHTTLDAISRDGVVALGRSERAILVLESADSAGLVRVNGRDYRGTIEIRRGVTGLVVVNRLGLERYIAGVVAAEMGERIPADSEALKAQAIVSRTYAIKNQGRWKDTGFDLVADVNDQAYAGQQNETPLASAAVAATRGEILTYAGAPIDAFYFSTCGGRTEDGTAAFAGAERPYLHAIEDRDAAGVAWCAISPRYQWTSSWTAAEMTATLKRTLPANNLPAVRATDLDGIRVLGRTRSGRIATLELTGRSGRTPIAGQTIRRVLSPPAGGLLRSTDFTVRITRKGGRIERVDIDGRGNGHGVGMCQWGAVGRSRAGQDHLTILTSYFPGTELKQAY